MGAIDTMTASDLQEFRLRHAALVAVAHQHLMVQDSYQHWVKAAGERYGFKGEVQIDLQTGQMTAVKR